ncbi:MOSC domain-containing protein [Amycolatopsis jejuensis]|uniref:MOSC domain-containing protein n=1 Tax=Amycolatopsis jejuensis TaxID=330084 RepID=UPI000689FA92|nr:MOSC domain-containing protein [Amycolatopsis jejuensis]
MMQVRTVSTGPVVPLPWRGGTVLSGFRKTPVEGRVEVGKLGLAGDEQGDRKHHGGPHKAVLLYPAEHYPQWTDRLGDLTPPSFGENLTTTGIMETDAVMGALYVVGTVILQVTQPRRPCYKLAAYHGIPDLAVQTQRTGRTGIYCRVLRPGYVETGDGIELLHEPEHGITVAEVHRVINVDRHDLVAANRLLDHPEILPESWIRLLRTRLDGRLDDQTSRLHGQPIE